MSPSIRKMDEIVITYYVGPHLFYFKYKDGECDDVLDDINNNVEKYVQKHIAKRRPNPHSPEIGEIVLCHYITDCINKWIRARVDYKRTYGREKFILWALDFGFPLETEPHWIRKLMSEELKTVNKGLIFKGGLYDIVPSTLEWNIARSAEEVRKTKKWTAKAVEAVEKFIYDADTLTFRCRAFLKDHFFGSLVVQTNTGAKVVVEDLLRNMKEGMDGDNFVKEFFELEKPSYWERRQQDAIFKIYENNSEHFLCTGAESLSSHWTSTDDLFNKTKIAKYRKFRSTKDNNTNDDTEEVPVNLSTRFPIVAKLLSQKGKVQSNSCNTLAESTSSKAMNAKDCLDEDFDVKSINAVPMNKRLAVAQQKYEEKGKITAMKQARVDEINKKLMGLSFPAGYIVDTKAIKEKEEEIKKRNAEVEKFVYDKNSSSTDDSTKTVKKNRYQKAQEYECFTVDHNQRILVHNHDNLPITSIKIISEANFPQEIHNVLAAKNINQVYRIQSFGWPSVMRGSSLILVSNAKTGKTWTYLPAICSLIIERIEDDEVVDGIGPLSIIACTSSEEVENIMRCCQNLIRNVRNPKIKCVKAYGFSNEREVVAKLLNGSEILIATIPRLYRLMQNDLNLFDKKRIISFVFDNIDLVYDQFSREINEIYKSVCEPTSNKPVQMIVTSRTWHKILEKFYMTSHFTLCIGSCIEAAVYARAVMTIELSNQKFKYDQLISCLSDQKYRTELTLVICNTAEDVEDLVKKLKSTSIKIWQCHDKTDSLDIMKIKEEIKESGSGDLNVLICTDDVLSDLDIRRAQHIVHFSLPPTWTLFTFRFSVFMEYYNNLLAEKMIIKPAATSVVLLDDKNNAELPRLIDFMQMRGNSKIPGEVLQFVELKRIEKEEQLSNIYKPFCNDLMTIGICHGHLSCQHRHILTKFDRSRSDIPRNGSVKFDIIAIHSPVYFTVRLREYRLLHENKWRKLQATDEFLSFTIELTKYFSDANNHIIHFPFNLGDLCVLCVNSNVRSTYERVKIIKIEEQGMAVLNRVVIEVLLIDSNERKSCNGAELMQLPERFKSFPCQAVDVRIADIRPCDFDSEWDKNTLTKVQNWIQNEKYNYCQGNIKLSIMNTLWVDSVDLIELLHSIREEVKKVSIKNRLLDGNLAVKDSKAMELLKSLAKKAGLFELNEADIALHRLTLTPAVGAEHELLFRKNSCSSSVLDIDDSVASRLNWTTSIESDDEQFNSCKENLSVSSGSSAEDETLLRESKDRWAELSLNQFGKVLLCNFYHPSRVYIRNSDSSSSLSNLIERIDEFTSVSANLKQLTNIVIAENCLAKIDDKFRRAKILKILHDTDGSTAEVFFVDLGEFLILPLSELIEIPKRFITELPFQAIFCKLIGIRPLNNTKMWCDTICDTIFDNIFSEPLYFYARPMQLVKPDKYTYGLKSRSYDVVLLNESGDININKWIVLQQQGEFDPESSHFIDILIDIDLNNGSSEEFDFPEFDFQNCDVEFDEEDIMKLMQTNNIPFSYEKHTEPQPAVIEEIPNDAKIHPEDESLMKKNLQPQSIVDQKLEKTSSSAIEEYGELASLHKFPKINWNQTASVIVLTVHAPDVEDYYLKVTSRLVKLYFLINQDRFATVLNLFGCVDVDYTSHEIRGLNIVIRLLKTLRQSWPRLIRNKGKYPWLQYNFEAISEELHEDIKFDTKNEFGSIHNPISTSESDDDDDDDFDLDSDN